MKRLIFFILTLVSLFADAADCPGLSSELSTMIEAHTREIRGAEYCEYRSVASGKNIEIALYSVEGPCFSQDFHPGTCGNIHYRYLIAIVNGASIGPFEVGKRGGFSASEMELNGNVVTLTGQKYGSNDPMCCPSVIESKSLTLSERGFSWVSP